MIKREISRCLTRLFRQYPIVTVTGPRQSGKTTLCRATFPDLGYANLEAPDQRDFAEADPRSFLSQFRDGAVLDEIQHVPHLLSYLQVIADERGENGLFVLTGSEQFRLSDAIGQSLAGRTALLRLLPFSMAERRRAGAGQAVDDILYSGFYPRIFDQDLEPREALGDYFENYVEREVRRLGGVRHLSTFRRFVRLCAGRVGQLINLTSLGSDVGVSRKTVREWLSVLERSYVIFQLEPYYANVGRRLIKSPKLYFYDVGLASYLVGIQFAEQLVTHPLRGALFENAVVVEALKFRFNRGFRSNLSFFRDARGLECDLLYETGRGVGAIEIKSGSTISSGYSRSLDRVAELVPKVSMRAVVYGGAVRQSRIDHEVVPLADVADVLERFEVEQGLVSPAAGPAEMSVDADTTALEAAYRGHVRPLLQGLESLCRPLADSLPGGARDSLTLSWVTSAVVIQDWLQTGTWEEAMRHLVEQGFQTGGEWRLLLRFDYHFRGYRGGAGRGVADLSVAAVWELEAHGCSRRVLVGGKDLPELNRWFHHTELEAGDREVGLAIAGVGASLIRQINSLSTS